ncbi:MAG TPA: hypothetical protein VEJ63_00920 [Planctomycetota bacterium]|nr:hypothetical protein [Planctomycetota bacterium]
MRMRGLSLILVVVVSGMVFGAEGPTTAFIFPPKPQPPAWLKPPEKLTGESPGTKNDPNDPATRRAIIVALRTQQEEEERRERIIRQARLREKAEQMPAVDPEKDDYRKYLRRKELEQQPEWQGILERYPEAKPRNDFAEWKGRQPERKELSPKGEAREIDWNKWLKAGPEIKLPERSKKPPQGDIDE